MTIHNYSKCLLRQMTAGTAVQQIRCTFVLRRIKPIPATSTGADQRRPDEKPIFMLYEVAKHVNTDKHEPTQPIEVILTKYVEGLGERGDVVKVPRTLGRHTLLLSGSAVYASPFNLKLFEEERMRRAEELKFMPKMSPEKWQMLKLITEKIVLVPLNLENTWTMNRNSLRLALRQSGLYADNESIVLPKDKFSGPDLKLEGRLFRFYVIINKQIIVPMIGRIHHVTSDETQQVLAPELDLSFVSDEELGAASVRRKEDVYIHPRPTLSALDSEAIWKVIRNRPQRT